MGDENDQAANELPPEWLSDNSDTEPAEHSLLRQLAEDEESGLIELADGVWYIPKLRPDRDKLA